MSETYSCTFANCDKVFSRAYELKKHKATHEDPSSVYYCSQCDFFTLQKKNLGIHFAIHTGEKIYQCHDMVRFVGSPGSPSHEERCEYKTNDPAALTRHRKKVHGYIPPLNRSRPSKAPPAAPRKPRKPRQKQDGKASRHPRRPVSVTCRKPSRMPHMANGSSNGAGYTSTSTQSPEDSSPFLWKGNVDAYRQWMDANPSDMSRYDSSMSSSSTLGAPDQEMDLTTLYDPSLQYEWMAEYEMGYSMFDMTGMRYLPQPLPTVPPSTSAPASPDMQTGQGGCLCPEWMVEAGIEGWDQSVLETHREFYVFDA